jgi:hypothetical protein
MENKKDGKKATVISVEKVLELFDKEIGIEYKTNEKYGETYVKSKDKKITICWISPRQKYISISIEPKFNKTGKWETHKVKTKSQVIKVIKLLKPKVEAYNPTKAKQGG